MAATNIKQVVAWLEQFVTGFNFELPGKDRNMGRDLAHVIAGRIGERAAVEGRGADPQPWQENSDRPAGRGYKSQKRKGYGWQESDGKPNYRTGQMLSHMSLMGETTVAAETVEMRYGINQPPSRTYSPRDNRTPKQIREDEAVTDREKAAKAHDQYNRKFYEIDDDITAAVIAEAELHLIDYITTKG